VILLLLLLLLVVVVVVVVVVVIVVVLLLLLLTALVLSLDGSSPFISTEKTNKNKNAKRNNTKNTVQIIQDSKYKYT
jgi:ATP/ADP translocase